MNDFSERIKICGELSSFDEGWWAEIWIPEDGVLCRAGIRLTGARMNCQSEHINKRNPIAIKRY